MYNIIDMSGHNNATTKKFKKALRFVRESLAKDGKTIPKITIEYEDEQITKATIFSSDDMFAKYEIVRAENFSFSKKDELIIS